MSNFMKIATKGAELFRADERTNGQTEVMWVTSLFTVFRTSLKIFTTTTFLWRQLGFHQSHTLPALYSPNRKHKTKYCG